MGGTAKEKISSQHIFHITMFNSRSLVNKLPELHHTLYDGCYKDCVCVTESWLHDGITDGLLDPKQLYTVLRYDRTERKGGGVCVFIKNTYNVMRLDLQKVPDSIELVCFDLLDFDVTYRVFVIYRSPSVNRLSVSCDTSADIMQQLTACLEANLNKRGPTIILGDFNCPDIDWQTLSCSTDLCHTLFYDFVVDNGFSQCITMPTRQCNILDLVLVNDPFIISRTDITAPFSTSDHNTVNIDILYCKQLAANPATEPSTKYFLWKSGDYDGMSAYLSHYNWGNLFAYNLTADSLWRAFCEVLDGAIEKFVPYTLVSRSPKQVAKKKYPGYIRELISRKRCLWRHCKRDPNNHVYATSYKKVAVECKAAIVEYERQQEKQVIDAGNSGRFFKYVNQKLGRSHRIGVLKGTSGHNVTEDAEKANLLNSYFNSVNTHDDGTEPEFQPRTTGDTVIDSIRFTPEILRRICRKIKPKMSSGPDGYPPYLLKNIVSAISSPLCLLFQSFLSVGRVPSAWKIAHIIPFYKKGDSSDPSNYRPISLTSVFCKLMERIVVADMLSYLRNHSLISKQQHGFLSKRSTTTNLLESLNDWSVSFENGTHQTIAYIDFAKAFDSVCHSKLVTKLRHYGISGDLLEWITDFLSDRTHRTVVGHCLSDVGYISSGVIQGSCLGPLLFLLYINDLVDVFPDKVVIKLYADDVKLYSNITTTMIDTTFKLQDQLDKLAEWASVWQLPISYSKCCAITVGRGIRHFQQQSYAIDEHAIQSVSSVVDLGVTVNNNLKFALHINKMCCKAHRRANVLLRCFQSKNVESLVSAFKAYVRPIIEYCLVVWNPCLLKDIKTI